LNNSLTYAFNDKLQKTPVQKKTPPYLKSAATIRYKLWMLDSTNIQSH